MGDDVVKQQMKQIDEQIDKEARATIMRVAALVAALLAAAGGGWAAKGGGQSSGPDLATFDLGMAYCQREQGRVLASAAAKRESFQITALDGSKVTYAPVTPATPNRPPLPNAPPPPTDEDGGPK